jgi:hypothetical protein
MKACVSICAWALCAAVAAAQPDVAQPQPQRPQPVGLETDWDISPTIQKLSAHAADIEAALAKIDARAWVEQGAPETYAEQVDSTREQAKYLSASAKALAANPQRLSAGLDFTFRMSTVETMLGSVQEGLRKYETPVNAQGLASLAAQGSADRDRLQQYLVALAAQREQELGVMDKEAQRCRAQVTAPPPVHTIKKK